MSLKCGVTQNACYHPQLPASTVDQVTGSDVLFLASLLANMPHRTVFRHVSSINHLLHAERQVPRPLHRGANLVFGGEHFTLVPVVDVTLMANRVVLRPAL
jgi:hypothetical protein